MHHEKSCCKLNANSLALAITIVAGIIYVICAAASIWWPVGFLELMNMMVHVIDLTKAAPGAQVTISGFFAGLLQTVIYTYAVVYLGAWFYNKLSGSESEVSRG